MIFVVNSNNPIIRSGRWCNLLNKFTTQLIFRMIYSRVSVLWICILLMSWLEFNFINLQEFHGKTGPISSSIKYRYFFNFSATLPVGYTTCRRIHLRQWLDLWRFGTTPYQAAPKHQQPQWQIKIPKFINNNSITFVFIVSAYDKEQQKKKSNLSNLIGGWFISYHKKR